MFVFFCWRCVSKSFWISGEAPFPKQVQLRAISFLCNTHTHTVHTHPHTSFNKVGSGRGVHCRNFIQILYWNTWTLLPLQPSSQEIITVLTTKTRWTDCVCSHTLYTPYGSYNLVFSCDEEHLTGLHYSWARYKLQLLCCSHCLSCKCDGLRVFTFIYLLFLVLLKRLRKEGIWWQRRKRNYNKRRNYNFCENESENWTTAEVC